jgi:ATP-binding cassette subfamily F protein 3
VLLHLEDIGKSFGARRLFGGVSLVVNQGDRIGLVGPNGAGKTTLLCIASGEDAADSGRVTVARGARVARLRQEIDPARGRTIQEEAASALAHLDALEAELRELEQRMAEAGHVEPALAERYDTVRHAFEHDGGFEREARIDRVLEGLGFDAARRVRKLSTQSGGWLMRVELAKLLLREPDVLLLDEPTNHLDLPSIQWFEETLQAFQGAVIVVSHDRTFLRRHVSRVAELTPHAFTVYEGAWDHYLAERELRAEQLEAQRRNQERKVADAERFIERFRYKASKARQVQSRVKALDKLERVEAGPKANRRMRLKIPAPARSGEVVLRLEGVHKSYGETRVYEGIDLEVGRGRSVALVGPNGAGKSTLLRLLAGVLEPDAGVRELGHRVEIAFYAQHQLEALDASRSVLEELESAATTEDHPRLRGHLGAFLFSGDDVKKKVSVLSGGEKARLALAKLLLRPSNVLVLDEPTNHLDVEACEVLESALSGYEGTLLFISHDRSFINALATHVIEVKAGALREFVGSYDDYLRKTAPAKTPAPTPAAATPEAASPATPAETKEERRRGRERRKDRDRLSRKLEKLEQTIAQREGALEELGHRLGDPDLWKDPERSQALEEERAALRADIDARYADWERLAAELEAVEEALGERPPHGEGGEQRSGEHSSRQG